MRKGLTKGGLRKGEDAATLRRAIEQYAAAQSQRRRDQIRERKAKERK